jgi:hypothetical protein
MTERLPPPQAGLALPARLWRRTEQPGCVRPGQAEAILARYQRMPDIPPLAGLLLARGRGIAEMPPTQPSIAATRRLSTPPGPTPEAAPGVSRPTARARLVRPYDPASGGPASGGPPSPRGETPLTGDGARATAAVPADGGTRRVPPAPAEMPAEMASGAASAGPAGSVASAASAGPDATGRPAHRDTMAPLVTRPLSRVYQADGGGRPVVPATGPGAPAGMPTGRRVVRPGGGERLPATARSRPSWPASGQDADSARTRAPVVRERMPPGGTWVVGPARSPRPAPPPVAPAAPATTLVTAGPAGRTSEPLGPARATREHRTERSEDRAGRRGERDERNGRERAAAPAVDMDHIVVTVQRRLMHQFAIDRERRGMTR